MAILAIISTAFENAVTGCFIFNALQASKMPAHPRAGVTRKAQCFPKVALDGS